VLGDPVLSAALVERGASRADDFAMSSLAASYVAIYRRIAT
jgi:hypothetical protein